MTRERMRSTMVSAAASKTGRFIYAAGDACPDQLYATGLLTPDPYLWVSVGDLSAVILSSLEVGRGRKQVRAGVLVFSEAEAREHAGLAAAVRVTPEALLPALGARYGIRRWETPASCPLGLAVRLKKAGITVIPVDALFPARQYKGAAEVEHVREGVRLAEAGLARALALLRRATIGADTILYRGRRALTAEFVRGEIAATIARLGGTAAHTIVAPGRQAADPHAVGEGPLRAGEPIVLDIFPRVDRTGYFGDLTRTVVKGRAAPQVRRAFQAVRAAQQAALRMIRGGVRGCDVFQAAQERLTRAGFTTDLRADPPRGFIHGLGHGLGLEIHEAPRLNSRAEELLAAGQVVTVEPGLYDPAWGGVRLEDVVVVRDDGCENLTSVPVCLEID